MNTYFFDDNINPETINSLVEKLNTMQGEVDLWFTTEGGQTQSMEYLIHYLNSRKEEITVTVVDRLWSAGTLLLLDFEGKLKLGRVDTIMFHMWDRQRYPLRKWQGMSDDKIQKQDLENNLEMAKKLREKKILSKKQTKKFLRGEDVTLYKKEIQKLKQIYENNKN